MILNLGIDCYFITDFFLKYAFKWKRRMKRIDNEIFDELENSDDELLDMASFLILMKRIRKRRRERIKKPRKTSRFWIRQIYLQY